ncbi:MAG: hypothetical protein FWG50_01415 [Kiritimatiellaeota bacterium]|nr:hypothetical protein [Kiritimatiellota bacterium]
MFDSKYFGRRDFFIEPDDLPKLAPHYEQLRRKSEEAKAETQELKQKMEGNKGVRK